MMSVHDQAAFSVLSQLALAGDGAVLGVALAYISVRSLLKFSSNSSALKKLQNAPSVPVSDLRSILSPSDSADDAAASSHSGTERLVIVRGVVEARSAVNGNWKSIRPSVLISHESGEKAVVLQRTRTCIYNEWRGLFSWTSDIRSLLFWRFWKEQNSSSTRTVPFILIEGGRWPQSDFVSVNLDGSKHPFPLTTVYHNLQPISPSPYTFLQAVFGYEYPVGLLDEEKILPVGTEITAVGLCSLKAGTPEIKSCKDLPFFLSDMGKDQMVLELAFRSKVLLWSGVVLGSLAIGVLGYAVVRNWNRWKEWRHRRQIQQQDAAANTEAEAEAQAVAEEETGDGPEETGDVPDGELCVICLTRRRHSAFIPCGHLVCCARCASRVEREASPKCPVCRQAIRTSVGIYYF